MAASRCARMHCQHARLLTEALRAPWECCVFPLIPNMPGKVADKGHAQFGHLDVNFDAQSG